MSLTNEASCKTLLQLSKETEDILEFTPRDLAAVPANHVRLITDVHGLGPILALLRRASEQMQAGGPGAHWAHPTPRAGEYWAAFLSPVAIAADSAHESEPRQAQCRAVAAVGAAQDEAPCIGPRAKSPEVSANAGDSEQIRRFTDLGAKLNVLRNSDVSLGPSAAAPRRRGTSCDLTRRPHFPPSEEAAPVWPDFFFPVRAFLMYLLHLENERHLTGWAAECER